MNHKLLMVANGFKHYKSNNETMTINDNSKYQH